MAASNAPVDGASDAKDNSAVSDESDPGQMPGSDGLSEKVESGHEDEVSPVDKDKEGVASPADMQRTKSSATDMSALTGAASRQSAPPERKPWYRRNPLRWGTPPPVPKEAAVSPEYGAGFFSVLTFQWIAPLMTVCSLVPLAKVPPAPHDQHIWTLTPSYHTGRPASSARSPEPTYTRSIQTVRPRCSTIGCA